MASTTWITTRTPRFPPDDVDGRVLFQLATARRATLNRDGTDTGGVAALGDIVMVPPVKDARSRGVLTAQPPFQAVTPTGVRWRDGREQRVDAINWCTGFRSDLRHLAPLRLTRRGPGIATRADEDPRIHLLGYGDWTGPASATLVGVGPTARAAISELIVNLPPQP